MKVPVDEMSIIVGLDGLALLNDASAALLEEILTASMAEAILRALEAERCGESVRFDALMN